MELELGLALPCSDLKNASLCCRKRGFDDMKTTLPLFMQKEDDGDGGDSDGDDREAEDLQGINFGARGVVGWPPVKFPRRNSGEDCSAGCRKRTNCVKVYMEGMAIGRKVDLSLHHSYEALFHTLNLMFPKKHHDGEENEGYYKVTYEDEDGDWMLIGDVPWEVFIQSVKRLKILN